MDLKLYLNGLEYNFTNRYTIKEQVGQPATSTFDIKLENNPLPVTHTKVILKDSGINIFAGYITKVDTPTYSSGFETDIVPLSVVSSETIFTRRIISGVWEDKFTHEIIQDIYDLYLVEENFTLGTIENFERKYVSYVVPNLRLSDVLIELGDDVGAVAKIDCNDSFSFTTKLTFPQVLPPAKISKMKLSENGQDLKTVQKVSGANADTSQQALTITWVQGQESILMGYQVSKEPNVTINGNAVEVGIIGIDEDNPDKTFLWKYGNNAMVLNSTATIKPVDTDIIGVIFIGFFNIEIVTENEQLKNEIALISGTSGKIESMVIDTSIVTPQDGETISNNLLLEKSTREQTVTLECLDIQKSLLLNQWYLNYPDLNIDGNYVIVERTITDFYDKYKINLKLKNRGFYSRYGKVYNQHTKEINNLAIRQDDVVITSSSTSEVVTWIDEWSADQDYMELTCGTTDIFSPVFFAGSTVSRG